MKKSVSATLISAIAMILTAIIVGYAFDFLIPELQSQYENETIFRPWDDPLMYLYFLQPFILSASLIWGWEKVKNNFQGSIIRKAFSVSLIYLFVSIIPGMLMSISTFQVSGLAIFTWTINAFVQVWIGSVVFIKMVK